MRSFLKKYRDKFYYAFCGISYGLRCDRSIRLQVVLGFIALLFFTWLGISRTEWMIVCLLIALVIAMEFVNSAVEGIVDLISPQYHPKAKIIKDGMAAAVLIISIAAALVAALIIGGKLL